MNRSIKLISASIITALSSTALADCLLDSASPGWIGIIKFHCTEDTNLDKNPISFDLSNHVTISSIWGLPANAQYTQNNNHFSVTVKKWWPKDQAYILPANQVATLQFSPSSNQFEISNFHVGSSEPTSQATIKIQLPQKPEYITDNTLADVIILEKDTQIAEINNKSWNSTTSIPVEFSSDSQKFSVSVLSLKGGTGYAEPATFTLSNTQVQNVSINYIPPIPPKTGNLLVNVSTNGNTPSIDAPYSLTDNSGTIIKSGYLHQGSNHIDQLNASDLGVNYILKTPNFIDNNTNYQADKTTQNVTITTNNTTSKNVHYIGVVLPNEMVNITVKDFPQDDQNQLIVTLSDSNSADKKTITITNNGAYSVKIPQNQKTWTLTASSINGYIASIEPKTFIANKETQSVNITYTNTPSNTELMPFKDVTYNMVWSTTPAHSNLQEIADNSNNYSYILAFITQNAWSQNCFAAWGGSPSLALKDKFYVNDVNYLKSKGGSIGISFGGENGSSVASACTQTELENVYQEAINMYQPTFIDFDIEGGALGDTEANTNRLNALKALQQKDPNLKVSLTLPANIDGFPAQAIQIIKDAKAKGVNIYEYNMMTMAWYAQKLPGPIADSVIAAANKGFEQLKAIFPNLPDQTIWSMIRLTPKIGVDYDQSIFYPSDATKVAQFVKDNHLAGVAFWSEDIDRNQNKTGNCGLGANPNCSGIDQKPYDFTHAFSSTLENN
ncbi:MAG: hypothetical protein EP298_02320 [Gammaproteobacteria bacterium]|nr:MAG: hypothetical protein EP298_02320 [Gammaproteobacteria bacterium]UTW43477.1 hypothetical protein KFE69_05120 [bacterium SCSIO 12844]